MLSNVKIHFVLLFLICISISVGFNTQRPLHASQWNLPLNDTDTDSTQDEKVEPTTLAEKVTVNRYGLPTPATNTQEVPGQLSKYFFHKKNYHYDQHSHHKRQRRKVVNFENYPWRKWTLPIRYKFDPGQTNDEKKKIRDVISAWKNLTCIRFQEVLDNDVIPDTETIIRFTRDNNRGCCSNAVGKNGLSSKEQIINLAQQCYSHGVITHEIGHVIGFYHEQVRPDRDHFVYIHEDLIQRKHRNNFQIQGTDEIDTMGIPYDYSSIMHYENNAFSKNESYTIVTKDAEFMRTIGQRFRLSFADIKAANMAYCQDKCLKKRFSLPCLNGGYPDPNNCSSCLCPDGFEGPRCSYLMKAVGESDCGREYFVKKGGEQSIMSPGYPGGYGDNQQCTWLLKAPLGYKVQAEFDGQFHLPCSSETRLCHDWVEIRARKDKAITSARFCCSDTPRHTFTSEDDRLLILFRVNSSKDSEGNWRKGFKINYRMVT